MFWSRLRLYLSLSIWYKLLYNTITSIVVLVCLKLNHSGGKYFYPNSLLTDRLRISSCVHWNSNRFKYKSYITLSLTLQTQRCLIYIEWGPNLCIGMNKNQLRYLLDLYLLVILHLWVQYYFVRILSKRNNNFIWD